MIVLLSHRQPARNREYRWLWITIPSSYETSHLPNQNSTTNTKGPNP